jgi:hypothetical protein
MDLRTGRVPVRRCDGRGRGRCRGSGRHGEPTFPDRVALSLALISPGTSSGKGTACLSSLAGRLEFLAVPRQRRIPLGDGKGLQDRLDNLPVGQGCLSPASASYAVISNSWRSSRVMYRYA